MLPRMYRDAYDEVIAWGQQRRLRDRLRERRTAAIAELDRCRAAVAQAERASEEEQRDVDRLEGASLTRVWLAIAGGVQERLDKERAEAAAARLRLEHARAEAELAAAELERLDDELAGLADVDAQYTRAFEDKTARLLAAEDDAARRIRALIVEVTEAMDLIREIDEALDAATWAQRYLRQACEDIAALDDEESMLNTAIYTTLFMSMSTPMPVAHRLEDNLRHAQTWIGRYAAELRDLPGWEQVAASVAAHERLLTSFVALVAGGSGAPGQDARAAIDAALHEVDRTRASLAAARPTVEARHDAARTRYRDAVERA